MDDNLKPVQFPEKAKHKTQELLQQIESDKMQFSIYVQGVFDSLELSDNCNWNLDLNTWLIFPIPTKPESEDN